MTVDFHNDAAYDKLSEIPAGRQKTDTMVDISQQIAYWRTGADEDWEVARQLVDSNKTRHGLFFAHLALEKLLKAHICKRAKRFAPKLHNLVRLAEMAELDLDADHLDILAEMNEFNLEGRYPITYVAPPTQEEALDYMKKARIAFEWLTRQL